MRALKALLTAKKSLNIIGAAMIAMMKIKFANIKKTEAEKMQKKIAAEFLGTSGLTFGGCGSALLAASFPMLGIGFVGVALAFGLSVLTMAYTVGSISEENFNPAVT